VRILKLIIKEGESMNFVEDRSFAEGILQEGSVENPGSWDGHSINGAKAAELIAQYILIWC
jgi:hypothetical protein